MKVALYVIGYALLFVIFVTTLFTLGENGARDRDCFEAGGKIIDGVCMPVENAINLQKETSGK
jgi:hypothetical protein